jgi:hypothetical protein
VMKSSVGERTPEGVPGDMLPELLFPFDEELLVCRLGVSGRDLDGKTASFLEVDCGANFRGNGSVLLRFSTDLDARIRRSMVLDLFNRSTLRDRCGFSPPVFPCR